MATEIFMPKAGMDMQEGKIIQWLKAVGDPIEEGEGILEIETDKVTMEVEATCDGVLLCTFYEDGDTVAVVTTIGYMGEAGEVPPKNPNEVQTDKDQEEVSLAEEGIKTPQISLKGKATMATPYAKHLAKENGINLEEVLPTGVHGEIKGRDIEAKLKEEAQERITPLAKRMAKDQGIDTKDILGSGHHNKIMKSDVLGKQNSGGDEKVINEETKVAIEAQDKKPLSGIKKRVAQRMVKAHTEIPCVTQNTKIDMTDLLDFRKQLNQNRENKITINDFILKATAKALRKHPEILVSIEGDFIVKHEKINIGVAVALEQGLIVPVIKQADQKGLAEISETMKDLASRARDGKLKMEEYQGATISISNLGMFGVHSFTPIINQPNSVILGVCAIEDELALLGGEVKNRKKMIISLTLDHRLLNGDVAAKFALTIKHLLENPMEILL